MTFGAAIKHGFKNLTNFSGRARRSEFWWFFLFIEIISLAFGLVFVVVLVGAAGPLAASVDPVTGQADDDAVIRWVTTVVLLSGVAALVGAVLQLLMLAANARRLHDTDQSAHWLWFYLAGLSIVPVLMAIPEGTPGPNKYGPDPKAAERAALLPVQQAGYAAQAAPYYTAQPGGPTPTPPPYQPPAAAPVADPTAPPQVPPASGTPTAPPQV